MFRPNRQFQAGLNLTEARRRREKNSLSLRRKERENKLQNKRKKILNHMRHQNQQTPSSNHHINEDPQARINELLRQLPRFIEGIQSNHKGAILECVRQVRVLLSFSVAAPIKQVIDTGIVPRIISFLQMDGSPEIVFESMWVLTNIASTKPEFTAFIVRQGALPYLGAILKLPNYPLQEQALWTLGNIAGDCVPLRNQVLHMLPSIFDICKTQFDENSYCNSIGAASAEEQYLALVDTLSWSLSNLCRGGRHTEDQIFTLSKCAYFLIEFKKRIRDGPSLNTIEVNISWMFSYLTGNNSMNEGNEYVISDSICRFGIVDEFIRLLTEKPILMRGCLKTIGNVLAGADDRYTQKCLELGILQAMRGTFKKLMSKHCGPGDYSYLKELCWSVSNICAGPAEHVEMVQKEELFPILTNLLHNAPYMTAREAMWAMANAITSTSETNAVISYLCKKCNLIEGICRFNRQLFNSGYQANRDSTLLMCFESIQSIFCAQSINSNEYCVEFETNGGCEFLERVQAEERVSQEVYNVAVGIIREWFDGEAEGMEGEDAVDISYRGDSMYGSKQFGFGFNTQNSNNAQNDTANRFEF